MTQFLQSYGIWIAVGIILLFSMVRFARSGGHHGQPGKHPVDRAGKPEPVQEQTSKIIAVTVMNTGDTPLCWYMLGSC